MNRPLSALVALALALALGCGRERPTASARFDALSTPSKAIDVNPVVGPRARLAQSFVPFDRLA